MHRPFFPVPSIARRLAVTALLFAVAGCAGGDGTEETAADRAAGDAPDPAEAEAGAGTPAAPPAAAPAGVPSLEETTFAPALEVDLGAMERRPSGLYVRVLEEGEGPPAARGDSMGVHYTVWLPGGQKLDSSHDHDPPAPYPIALGVTSLIEGWVEGVTGMRPGERRRLVVPYDLAYGARGRPGVPPHTPLVFEVELAWHRPQGG